MITYCNHPPPPSLLPLKTWKNPEGLLCVFHFQATSLDLAGWRDDCSSISASLRSLTNKTESGIQFVVLSNLLILNYVFLQILSLEKQVSSDQPSSIQVRKSSVPQPSTAPSQRPSASDSPLPPPTPVNVSTYSLQQRDGEPYSASPPRSTSNLSMSSSQKHLPHKESTPSLASDISLPFATLELQQRLRQLQKYMTHTLSRYIGPHFFNAFLLQGSYLRWPLMECHFGSVFQWIFYLTTCHAIHLSAWGVLYRFSCSLWYCRWLTPLCF